MALAFVPNHVFLILKIKNFKFNSFVVFSSCHIFFVITDGHGFHNSDSSATLPKARDQSCWTVLTLQRLWSSDDILGDRLSETFDVNFCKIIRTFFKIKLQGNFLDLYSPVFMLPDLGLYFAFEQLIFESGPSTPLIDPKH